MDLDGLTAFDKEVLLRFFLYRMSMDIRHDLIAEFPQAYHRLYPEVSATTITDIVSARIREVT